jgi:XisH protein
VLIFAKKIMAKDKIHTVVKEALAHDGWHITHDPYYLKVLEVEQEIDLGAEEIVAAELEGKKIAIEIKSFLRGSFINEFHGALGQLSNRIRRTRA